MNRRDALTALGAATLAACVLPRRKAHAAQVIKIGTTATATSLTGQILNLWAGAIGTQTNQAVQLQLFYNGTQGDEPLMVGKMKSGELDGAVVTSSGLAKIYRPIVALELPGLFQTWEKLDSARAAVTADFAKGASDAGFNILGWSDSGLSHIFSRGYAVKSPDDLKGKKPWARSEDSVLTAFFQSIGVRPVSMSVSQVLAGLNSGSIDLVIASSGQAEELQWSVKMNNVVSDVFGVSIGALVISSRALSSLTPDQRNIVLDTGKTAASSLRGRLRTQDSAAFERIKGKLTVTTLPTDQQTKWQTVYKATRDALVAQQYFSADLISKLESLAK